jgi:hypothetical protein
MDEATLANLRQLAKCLADASSCITQIPDGHGLEAIRAQLLSLQLILDRNREALRLRITDLD